MTHGQDAHEGASDARLAIAASHGDDAAFATLYGRYAPRIEAYLARLLADRHLAEDVTHEVFVSALRRLRDDRPPIAFGPWLYRIARNAAIDVHRRAQLARQVPLMGVPDELGPGAGGPEDEADVRHRITQLLGALDGLSEGHRQVLVLRELEGLSNGDIAERMGITRPAVEALLFRARARVKREYEELVSGRRCSRVRLALDAAGAGTRLGRRERDVAARHLRTCRACRRHAWEAGVAASVVADAPAVAALPVPALALAFSDRTQELARNLLVPWSVGPPAAAPWGRALAILGVLAVGAGTGDADRPAAAAPVAPLVASVERPAPLPSHARPAGHPRHHRQRAAAHRGAPRKAPPPAPAAWSPPAGAVARPAAPRPAAAPVPRPVRKRPAAAPPHAEPAEPVKTRVAVTAPVAGASASAGAEGAAAGVDAAGTGAAGAAGTEGATVRVAAVRAEVAPQDGADAAPSDG